MLVNWVGQQLGVCLLVKYCGYVVVMEFNGDVYVCDYFVFFEYKLGNIYQKILVEMMYGKEQEIFGVMKYNSLLQQCLNCFYEFVCYGECLKNCFMLSKDGELGLNYLCKGYY